MEKPYKLRYLPAFYDDLQESVNYITIVLKNPQAADKLIDTVERSIVERLPLADRFEEYCSAKERKHPYYRIRAGKYFSYYVVLENDRKKIMEVRRLLHSRRDRSKHV